MVVDDEGEVVNNGVPPMQRELEGMVVVAVCVVAEEGTFKQLHREINK